MQQAFHTRRLIVRPIVDSDFAAVQRTKRSSTLARDERNGSTLAISHGRITAFRSMVDSREELMAEDRAYYFGVFSKATGEFIGEVMLCDVLRGNQQSAIIGAIVHSPFRRKGYAREAMRGLVRFAFRTLALHRIEGQADPANRISIAMCRKAGFRLEGTSPGRLRVGRRWKDAVILAVTPRDL